jgi:signal transduction histidine kinase
MSREASGLRLSLHSLASYQDLAKDVHPERYWLRYGVLLLVVVAGIGSASAVRLTPTNLVSLVVAGLTNVWSTAGLLAVSATALLLLGCVRFLLGGASRERLIETKRKLLSVTPDSSPRFWRAQEDERKHLSRELHDSVGQTLTAVGLQLCALRSTRLSPEEMRSVLDETCRLNAEAMRQVRDLAMGLRPTLLEDVSLVTALDWQARQFSRQSGIAVSLEASGQMEQLPEQHRLCIYRCVQEALTNCAKHARAKNIRIVMRASAGLVHVTITDDGIGFDSSKSVKGLGLLGMRERMADISGTLSVDARDQSGTALTLEIPVPGGVLV